MYRTAFVSGSPTPNQGWCCQRVLGGFWQNVSSYFGFISGFRAQRFLGREVVTEHCRSNKYNAKAYSYGT